jgi:epoxyqueuosine reductase
MTIKQALQKEAYTLGFSAFGVASAEYDPVEHNNHLRWLEKGYQGDMKYLERGPRQRFDARVHLAEASAVIVCALDYYTEPEEDSERPYVSIYARGENYHTVVGEKLEALCRKMREFEPDVHSRIFVDSSPISEKSFAVKAGIGFLGRNGNLIIPKKKSGTKNKAFGSFFFLGLIITSLKLEADSPIFGTCGECRKCIEACPTDAIVGDGIIDATRCISYQTTQNKGAIPDEIAGAMGNMIFGCDICQLVCPYNSAAVETSEPRFAPSPDLVRPGLQWLSSMTEDEFGIRFGKSCIGEFQYDMFKRNVSVARDNFGGPKRNKDS